jgi:hypothetical protein
MILFCNTFITEQSAKNNWNYQKQIPRKNLKSFSNFDTFKYSLASLAVAYDWSKVILKISLDDIYKHRQQELEEFIDSMQQKDLEKFKDFFDKMPEIKKDVKFKCPVCDYEEEITIKGMQNFFV